MNRAITTASPVAITISIIIAGAATLNGCALMWSDGRHFGGRGPWEWTVICSFGIAAVLTFFCYKIGLKRGPAFGIVDGKLEHFAWREPVSVETIENVSFENGNWLLRQPSRLTLHLRNGETRDVPTFLLSGDNESIGLSLCAALGQNLDVSR